MGMVPFEIVTSCESTYDEYLVLEYIELLLDDDSQWRVHGHVIVS